MKGSPKVIEQLQKAVKSELQAINQYVLHAAVLENWGYAVAAKAAMATARVEMRHLDAFMDRLMFLEALPIVGMAVEVKSGDAVAVIDQQDLANEFSAVALYRTAIDVCVAEQDQTSRDLFAATLREEEEHVNYLETEIRKIKALNGAYLAELTQEEEG